MAKKTKFWFKNEKEVMRKLGFEPVVGSGSGWVHKEDGESDVALAQLKSTEAESYRLNYLDIEKLEYHAAISRKIPVFVIEFFSRGTYILLNVNDFERIKDLCFEEEAKRIDKDKPMLVIEDIWSGDTKVISSSGKDRTEFYKEREKQWSKKKKQR